MPSPTRRTGLQNVLAQPRVPQLMGGAPSPFEHGRETVQTDGLARETPPGSALAERLPQPIPLGIEGRGEGEARAVIGLKRRRRHRRFGQAGDQCLLLAEIGFIPRPLRRVVEVTSVVTPPPMISDRRIL